MGQTGPQGSPGPAGLTWRGGWSTLVQYQANEAVFYGGSSWVALAPSVGVPPAAGSAYWTLLAAAGTAASPGLTWRGAWVSTTPYNPNDVVTSGGSSWVARVASTNSTPSTSSAYWSLLAQAGTNGANGVSGLEYNPLNSVSVPAGGTTASVGCSTSGKKVISGGYTGSSNSIYAVQSYPNSATNTWTFRFVNTGTLPGIVNLYAVCAVAG